MATKQGSSWTEDNMPMLDDTNILITGGNSGIGLQVSRQLARKNAHVFMLADDLDQGERALEYLRKEAPGKQYDFFQVDLEDFESIRKFSKAWKVLGHPLHVLINIAEKAMTAETDKHTKDGLEKTLAVNVYGTLYLTHLLLEDLKASTPSRLLFMSSPVESSAQAKIDWDNVTGEKYEDNIFEAYANSNVMRLMLVREMAERLQGTGVDVFATEPGATDTPLFDKLDTSKPMAMAFKALRAAGGTQGVEQGALSTLYAATAPELDGKSGKYFGPLYAAGVSLNIDNTGERSIHAPEARDPAQCCRFYEVACDIIEQKTGEPLPNRLRKVVVGDAKET